MRDIAAALHVDHPKDRHLDTIAIANTALAQITTHAQPADPRSYELWYKFATGKSGLLCAAVGSRLDRSGTLSRKDIYRSFQGHQRQLRARGRGSRAALRRGHAEAGHQGHGRRRTLWR
jgi:hypothetical protein